MFQVKAFKKFELSVEDFHGEESAAGRFHELVRDVEYDAVYLFGEDGRVALAYSESYDQPVDEPTPYSYLRDSLDYIRGKKQLYQAFVQDDVKSDWRLPAANEFRHKRAMVYRGTGEERQNTSFWLGEMDLDAAKRAAYLLNHLADLQIIAELIAGAVKAGETALAEAMAHDMADYIGRLDVTLLGVGYGPEP